MATSLVEHNIALADLQCRAGQLLAYDGVHLTEGPWTAAPYGDAQRHSEARANAWDSKFLRNSVEPFAQWASP